MCWGRKMAAFPTKNEVSHKKTRGKTIERKLTQRAQVEGCVLKKQKIASPEK